MFKSLILLLISLPLFSANYLVQINETELRTIQACIINIPTTQLVQMCINHKRFDMRYNKVGYGWQLEKVEAKNEINNCSCLKRKNADIIATSKTIVRQRVTFREVWTEEIPDVIIINRPSDLTKLKKKDKLDTDIICVKCGE